MLSISPDSTPLTQRIIMQANSSVPVGARAYVALPQ
jgi:hypothetical protein